MKFGRSQVRPLVPEKMKFFPATNEFSIIPLPISPVNTRITGVFVCFRLSRVLLLPMKTLTKLLVVFGVLAQVPAFAAQADTTQSGKHLDLQVWIDAKVGTHLGSGYTSSYLTNIHAKTMAREDRQLRTAIEDLDNLGMVPVRGFGLVPAAVSWQTEVPIRTLVEQQAETRLSYGELLVANALAARSGETFHQIISQRVRTATWGDLAKQLNVTPDFLVRKANLATDRIRLVEFNARKRPQKDSTNMTTTNPAASHFQHQAR